MNKDRYLEKVSMLYNNGKISVEAYDAMIENVDAFCDNYDNEYNLPSTYAEIEYDDMDDPEAIMGCRFDDMNYLRYMER